MIKIKSNGRVEEEVAYFIEYRRTTVYRFPCTMEGDINFADLSEGELINYETCESDPEVKYIGLQREIVQVEVSPRIGICWCGEDVRLSSNLNKCSACGKHFNPLGEEVNPIRVVCSWCGKHMKGDKKAPLISHGICEDCKEKVVKEIEQS